MTLLTQTFILEWKATINDRRNGTERVLR